MKPTEDNLGSAEFEHSHIGYIFEDLESGKVLKSKNEDKIFIPASNIKLLSLYAGLKVYPDSLPSGCMYETGDSLIFSPSGDPSFLFQSMTNEKLLNRLSSPSLERLYVYIPKHDEEYYGKGWAWDDDGERFQAGRFPLAIYGGNISVTKEPEKPVKIAGQFFDDRFVYQPQEIRNTEIELKKKPFSNDINLSRKINKNDDFVLNFSFYPNSDLVLDFLSDTLDKEVRQSYYFPQSKDADCFYHPSEPLLREMSFNSNNYFAEQLMYMIGYEATQVFSVENGINFAKSNLLGDLDLSRTNWVDGSGLSRYNKSTPHTMTRLLKRMIFENDLNFVKGFLPEGGKEGTLSNYYWSQTPYVWAKSGSLSDVYTLTGILKTTKGKDVLFSIMINNYIGSRSNVIKEVEFLLQSIRDKN